MSENGQAHARDAREGDLPPLPNSLGSVARRQRKKRAGVLERVVMPLFAGRNQEKLQALQDHRRYFLHSVVPEWKTKYIDFDNLVAAARKEGRSAMGM